jgi:hypothetical protein
MEAARISTNTVLVPVAFGRPDKVGVGRDRNYLTNKTAHDD